LRADISREHEAFVGNTGSVRRSRIWWGLLAVALLLRAAIVRVTPGYTPIHDDHSYLIHAVALVRTGAYPLFLSHGIETPTAYRAPGFPVVLAIARAVLGSGLLGARLVQVLVATLGVALVGIVAHQIWGLRTALAATALAALSPLLVVYSGSLISEPLFVALELGALACALEAHGRPRWAIAAGVLGGAAALTRPAGLAVLIALALCAGGRRAALLVVCVGALTIAPWTIRNAEVLHAFVPISTEAGNTLAGTYNAKSAGDGLWRDPRLADLYPRERARTIGDGPATDAILTRAVIHYIADHPLQPLKVAWFNAGRLSGLAPTSFATHSLDTVSLPDTSAPAVRLGLVLMTALAIAGVFTRAARRAPPGWWVAAGLVLAATLLVNAEQRFAVPVQAFLAPLAVLPFTRGD
jgi:4-amino-4-deoxy-L-arabinose transferase-like glycosyltransferase